MVQNIFDLPMDDDGNDIMAKGNKRSTSLNKKQKFQLNEDFMKDFEEIAK